MTSTLLINAPSKMWEFTKGDFTLYERPDPGTYVIDQDYIIAKSVSYKKGGTHIYRTEFLWDKFLFDCIEWIARRFFGSCLTAILYLTAFPIGYMVKSTQSCACSHKQ